MSNVVPMRGIKELPPGTPKNLRSQMDTLLLTPEGVASWKVPPFQRPLRMNAKLQKLVEDLKNDGGVIPGVITIGMLDRQKYLVDGQHRVEAFKLSGLAEGFADVRICHFDTMGEMGQEFVNLQSSFVRFKPDDILRGLEESHAGMKYLRKKCPFIGYDQIRRGANSPIVSMSLAIRCWFISEPECPVSGVGGIVDAANRLTQDEAEALATFLTMAMAAYGKDPEYSRLWTTLNLAITAWFYRRVVLTQYSPASTKLTREQFQKCMMAQSASHDYLDWLVGRQLCDRDRSPCYDRIKRIFAARIFDDTQRKVRLPSPAWAHGGGGKGRLL